MIGSEIKHKLNDIKPLVKIFNCPSCGSNITLRAMGYTLNAVCSSCFSIIDSNNENYQIISQAKKKSNRKQIIPLGRRGKIHGHTWEVIGYLERSDKFENFMWSEYLLFNPMMGFRWLSEFDGHWNYIITVKTKPEIHPLSVGTQFESARAHHLGKDYYLFHQDYASIKYILGEFYWKIELNQKVLIEDYICPPEILTCEKNDKEVLWCIGEYTPAEKIKQAFQIEELMPTPIGVAPNQPSTMKNSFKNISTIWYYFIFTLIIIQFFIAFFSLKKTIHASSHYYQKKAFDSNDTESTIVTPSFEVEKRVGNVEIKIFAELVDNWIEFNMDLVNENTGEITTFGQGIEYYSGVEDGEIWREGDQTGTIVLSSIPQGKYHLTMNISGSNSTRFFLKIVNDVVIWSNFFITLILGSLLPLYYRIRSGRFELDRWSQSDFSSYYAMIKKD